MSGSNLEALSRWYDKESPRYSNYAGQVSSLLEKAIKKKGIPFHSITQRVKEKDSFLRKCIEKEYSESKKEIMDIAGIRVIAYTNSDVRKISEVIKELFAIDEEESGDKAEKLSKDKVGYLSVHFIAKLKSNRDSLVEYEDCASLNCEIQVRTLLQHAWAEIGHDRSYKFHGTLPPEIARRFNLVAGTLEMVDNEFQSLSDAIEKYEQNVQTKSKAGELDIEVNSTSLYAYLESKFANSEIIRKMEIPKELIEELADFSIETIRQFDDIIPEGLDDFYYKRGHQSTYVGFVRTVLIINDATKYFRYCWKNHWSSNGSASMEFWRHYVPNIQDILLKYGVM